MRWLALIAALFAFSMPAHAQVASPYAIDIPDWFTESLLEMRDEVRDAAALDYVASGACRKQPSCQRFLQARGERLRGRGAQVDLWN